MGQDTTAFTIDLDQWLLRVDEVTLARVGCSVHDLPDLPFRDSYDAGDTPDEFFETVVRAELPDDPEGW